MEAVCAGACVCHTRITTCWVEVWTAFSVGSRVCGRVGVKENSAYFLGEAVCLSVWCYSPPQILLGLNHMHWKKILHRDIKTLNVFLDDDLNVKLGDMGVAKVRVGGSKANAREVPPRKGKGRLWVLLC